MKKILYILVLLPMVILGQTTTQNYIKTTTYKKPTSEGSVNTSNPAEAALQVNYFDGLGRPIQQIAQKQSGTGNNMVTHIEYDGFGRQVKEYLPIVNGQSLDYQSIDGASVGSYYSSPAFPTMATTGFPYSKKLFEASPLNRVLKQAAPGDDWQMGSGHEVKFDYQTNNDNEVKLYKATTNWNATNSCYDPSIVTNLGFYSATQLYKTITKDENWVSGNNNTTEEFKDKEGRVILKRTYNNGASHDTYYVYDDFGNLTYVIPPIVNPINIDLDDLCYQYKYDHRNRLVEKKLPGKQWEFIAYNSQDMPVATGPAKNPWGENSWGWLITKYDTFGRVVYTGWYSNDVNQIQRVAFENSLVSTWAEQFKVNGETVDNVQTSYTNTTFPTDIKLLTINYYDSYDYVGAPSLPATVEGQPVLANVKSLATGNWIRILDLPTKIDADISYTLYDFKGRAIRNHKLNYLAGHTTIDSKLDFVGKPAYTFTYHKRDGNSTEIVVMDSYEYTPQDRLYLHKQKIYGQTEELITKNEYDDLGQLISKQVGGQDVSNFVGLQKVDYRYNIRGWLTGINNDPANNGVLNTTENDLFLFKINYNTVEDDVSQQVKALYNGNISETFWRSSTDDVLRKYGYQYDDLNRLTNSFYQKPNNSNPLTNMYNEQLSYDKNGNILTLNRNGDYDSDIFGAIEIDDLSYSYDSHKKNQLMKVTDASNSPKGFKDDSNGTNDLGDDYKYDANGNMTADENKGIGSIEYNHLNLPVQITFASGSEIKYLYNAIGQKVAKTVTVDAADTLTDYLDGYQYTNALLNFFPQAEGYVNVTNCPECQTEYQTRFNYVYQYKDHLGNIRLSYGFDESEQIIKIIEENHYYPFGLKHTKYNTGKKQYEPDEENPVFMKLSQVPAGETILNKYKFQGQERQDELGLNWDSFKWRNYDPAIGRFMSIDPLAEKYSYQSPYNFSENKVIAYRELEGLEGVLAIFYHGGPTGGGQPTTVTESGTTGDYFVETQTAAGQSGNDFAGTIIAPGWTSASGVETGMDFFNANYQDGDKVIIYGYSYGVDVAVDLATELKAQNCNVDLLVTVDGSDGPLMNSTVNTTIPSNVKKNVNVFQTERSGASSSSRSSGSSSGATSSSSGSNSSGSSNKSKSGSSNSPGSHGGPNKAANPKKTKVTNTNVSAPGTNHGNVQQKAKSIIEPALVGTARS